MAMPAYSVADIEALLSVCRRELGTAGADGDIRFGDDRWRGLIAATLDHGLIGPLYKAALKAGSAPDHILTSVRTAYLTQAARNLQLTTALTEILRAFAECDIEVAVFKGPALALMVYGQITYREFTDLDLLVRAENIKRARLALNNLGYRQLGEDIETGNAHKDIQFLRDVDGAFVELHWALNPPNNRFPLEATGIWDRFDIVYFQNEPIITLSVEDTLIYLCIHASKHRWTSLKWAFDIAQILTRRAATLNWKRLLQRCTAVGCTRTLFFAVQLATRLFAVKMPAELAVQISMSASLMRLVEAVKDSLLQSTPLKESDLMKCAVEIHDRFSDRLFIATLPFPELPHLLPAALQPITSGPLRFITRPIRLLSVYGLTWFRTAIVDR
jgi:hypothetical protein